MCHVMNTPDECGWIFDRNVLVIFYCIYTINICIVIEQGYNLKILFIYFDARILINL